MYLKGSLPEADQKVVEDALKKYPELNEEIDDYSEVERYYQELEKELPAPSEELYSKIIDNIKTREKQPAIKIKTDYFEIFQNFLKNLFMSPKVAWACAACAILVMLVVVPTQDTTVKTLTKGTVTAENTVRFNIIFKEDAMEKDIRELINSVNARIIDGPAPNGLYVLEVMDQDQKEAAKTKLNASPFVRFAEIKF